MIIIETPTFTRRVTELMSDDAYLLMQIALLRDPEIGAVIPHSGGLRKLRWQLTGRGKRGGARVIYYWVRKREMILMLLAYSKNEQDDLTPEQAKALSGLVKKEFK
jgi:mRNA-degrading endonuclease RelE of RelBE toxin-antitoxin system